LRLVVSRDVERGRREHRRADPRFIDPCRDGNAARVTFVGSDARKGSTGVRDRRERVERQHSFPEGCMPIAEIRIAGQQDLVNALLHPESRKGNDELLGWRLRLVRNRKERNARERHLLQSRCRTKHRVGHQVTRFVHRQPGRAAEEKRAHLASGWR
jgi:hypothetical protein